MSGGMDRDKLDGNPFSPVVEPRPVNDPVNPAHYKSLDPEPIVVIEAWRLTFCTGNAVKYIARSPMKGGVEDLKKARWYLDREISRLEKK